MKKNLLRFLCFTLSFPANLLQARGPIENNESLLSRTFPQVSQRIFDDKAANGEPLLRSPSFNIYDGRTYECTPDGNLCHLITAVQEDIEIESCEGEICRSTGGSLIVQGKKSDASVSLRERTSVPQESSEISVPEESQDVTLSPIQDFSKESHSFKSSNGSKEFHASPETTPLGQTYQVSTYQEIEMNLVIRNDDEVDGDRQGAPPPPPPPPTGIEGARPETGAAATTRPPPRANASPPCFDEELRARITSRRGDMGYSNNSSESTIAQTTAAGPRATTIVQTGTTIDALLRAVPHDPETGERDAQAPADTGERDAQASSYRDVSPDDDGRDSDSEWSSDDDSP